MREPFWWPMNEPPLPVEESDDQLDDFDTDWELYYAD